MFIVESFKIKSNWLHKLHKFINNDCQKIGKLKKINVNFSFAKVVGTFKRNSL